MAWVEVEVEGEAGARRAEVAVRPLVVGRGPDCDLVIDHGSVSRAHARIGPRGGGVVVEDLSSRNGTFVNGARIRAPTRLASGDRIELAPGVALVFRAGDDTVAPDPPRREDEGPADTALAGAAPVVAGLVRPEAKLEAIVEITRGLAGALRLEDLLPQLLATLFRILPAADRGFVLLRDEASGALVTAAAMGRDGAMGAARVSRTIVERVLRTGEAVLSADAGDDARFDPSQSIVGLHIRSVMCVPLCARSRAALGVLQLHAESPRGPFTEGDLEILVAVAAVAALAVENVRLHEEFRARERLARELELAREVQRGFLPPRAPRVAGYWFHASYVPAASVGGDYYGFVERPGGGVVVAVGDVSGKGMPAALLMARLSSEVRSVALATHDPALAVAALDRSLGESAGDDRFVTLLYMVLDPAEHVLAVVNAGHLPPLVRRPDGTVEEVGADAAGLPLNVLPGRVGARAVATRLEPGTVVVAVTDGVTEAADRSGTVFGVDRLRALLARDAGVPDALGAAILADVRAFAGSAALADDVTVVAFGRAGPR